MTSKIELGVFLFFCAICATLGHVTHALIEPAQPEELMPTTAEPEEPLPVEPVADAPEAPATAEPESSATTPTSSQPIDPESIYIKDSYATVPDLISLEDYVHGYAGLCPSEQPKNHRAWEHERFVTALGVWSQWPTPEHYVETYWSEWHISPRNDIQDISSFANMNLANTQLNHRATVYIDWSRWAVFWDATWPDERPYLEKVSATYPAEWDTTVVSMQSYLRKLESQYRQLCPND